MGTYPYTLPAEKISLADFFQINGHRVWVAPEIPYLLDVGESILLTNESFWSLDFFDLPSGLTEQQLFEGDDYYHAAVYSAVSRYQLCHKILQFLTQRAEEGIARKSLFPMLNKLGRLCLVFIETPASEADHKLLIYGSPHDPQAHWSQGHRLYRSVRINDS